MSAIPTINKSDRGFPSDSLLFAETSELLDDDELDTNNSSSLDRRMGLTSYIVAAGSVLLSTSIMSIWMGM